MTHEIARNLISRLTRHDFSRFVFDLLHTSYGNDLWRYEGLDDTAFVRHGAGMEEAVYLIEDVPFEVFRAPQRIDIKTPSLRGILARVKADYQGRVTFQDRNLAGDPILQSIFFVNNLCGYTKNFYLDVLLRKYEILVADIWPYQTPQVGLGNADLFLENAPDETLTALTQFLQSACSGVSIELSGGRFDVRPCFSEKYVTCGVARLSNTPCAPVFSSLLAEQENAVQEFQELLSHNPREDVLEKFIAKHYKDIFGWKYDRIETQIWLRFPELDINAKGRRLDVFLRNSISADWDLFELKRLIPLSATYRDCPVLAQEIYFAIQQVLNYEKLLRQERVKERLAREGIDYCEPSLHLVVGRSPDIPHEQWRWLMKTNSEHVRILTYEELLGEMRIRLKERSAFCRACR